jgi:hypothetical protein
MKKQQVVIIDALSRRLRTTTGECGIMAFVCLVPAVAGCGKPPEHGPEKMLMRTTVDQPIANVWKETDYSSYYFYTGYCS